MSEESIVKPTLEIFELILATSIFLLTIFGIFTVSNPDFFKAKIASSELSYMSSQISESDIIVQINYKDITVNENENKVSVVSGKTPSIDSIYYGEPVQISQEGQTITIQK